jgi:putative Holliday junction resolvase
MRWMGLDVGDRRIGVAISDPLEITAQSHSVIERQSLLLDLEKIHRLITDYGVEGLVVGLPMNMNGSEGPMAEKVRRFAADLEKITGLAPRFCDERLSTVSAQRALLEADMSRSKRKQTVDKTAAAIILQNFLDGNRR